MVLELELPSPSYLTTAGSEAESLQCAVYGCVRYELEIRNRSRVHSTWEVFFSGRMPNVLIHGPAPLDPRLVPDTATIMHAEACSLVELDGLALHFFAPAQHVAVDKDALI